MRAMESSYLSKRLAGVDQALEDGSARSPGELLDALRERLERLEPNHPSAYGPRPAEAQVEAAAPDQDVAAGAEDVPDDARPPRDTPDDGQVTDGGQPDSAAQPAEAEPEGGGWHQAQGGAGGVGRSEAGFEAGTGLIGQGDPYRPWFVDGEPGTPWFAE
jgi:hypothetical protein